MSQTEVPSGKELVDVDSYVAATAGLYKKNGGPKRRAAVEAQARRYAQEVLPSIMIDRGDPVARPEKALVGRAQ